MALRFYKLFPADIDARIARNNGGPGGDRETEAERRRQTELAALSRLAALAADLPPVDAVRIARESRDELERRPHL